MANVLAPILQGRWIILIITPLVMLYSVWATHHSALYKSQAFFQFGGPIPLPMEKLKSKLNVKTAEEAEVKRGLGIALIDYKRYAASYSTGERFDEYIKEKKLADTPGIEGLRRLLWSQAAAAKAIEPVYAFTKMDEKELPGHPKDSDNHVIGLRIHYQSESPEEAQKMVALAGRYAMDSILYFIYSELLLVKQDEIKTRTTELDNFIIAKKTRLEEYDRTRTLLRGIIARNPREATHSARQMVNISEENIRFLPPITLLMANEIQMAEANEVIRKAKREQAQNEILLEYYNRAQSLLGGTKSGETLLRGLEPIKTQVFKNKDMQNDMIKEVYNMITVDNQKNINTYFNKSRFIGGPTLPSQSDARPVYALGVGFWIGLLLSITVIFLRKWWQENKAKLLK